MTPAEIEAFLSGERTLILATTRPSGSPVQHALWFAYLDGAVYVDTQAGSFKHRNIRRDDRVCCLVEAGESYFELRGVMIEGRARVVDDEAERERVRAAFEAKAARIGSGLEEMPLHFAASRRSRAQRDERILLRIPLEHVRSWDFGKTRGHYRPGSGS
jgi:PPOX class probable F420-dependent enzyme